MEMSLNTKYSDVVAKRTLGFVASVSGHVRDLTVELGRKFTDAACESTFFVSNNLDHNDVDPPEPSLPYLSANIWAEKENLLVDMLVEISARETDWLMEANTTSDSVERELPSKQVGSFDELLQLTPTYIDNAFRILVRACIESNM